jgi:malonyl-CoA O-methyltransferase
MSHGPEPPHPRRDVDPRAVARAVARLAESPEPPWLHGEVARRMAERLPMILRTPASVAQWPGHLGASDALLAAAYPKAQRLLVEPDPQLARRIAQGAARSPWWSRRRWTVGPPTVTTDADLPAAAVQLLWSNMMLHAVSDPPVLFGRWKRTLTDDGFLMFSTFGPQTLAELHTLYRELGWPPPAAPFVDMHDLGDMLVEAGFADPVMDQEQLTLTWRDADTLLAELRAIGANVSPQRAPGLRTPRWRRRLVEALEGRRDAQGRLAMRVEIVYGHAFNAPPRAKVSAHTEVPFDDLRRMARAGRKPRSSPI